MEQRRIEYMPLDDITPAARNPKRHDIAAIRASIGRFGFATPALRDERTGRLVVGHGRVEALRAMRDDGEDPPAGIRTEDSRWLVPVVFGWASRSDQEAEAYLAGDNNLSALGGWDNVELAALLSDLAKFDPALLEVAGYGQGDLEQLLAAQQVPDLSSFKSFDDVDDEPDSDTGKQVTCPNCGTEFQP